MARERSYNSGSRRSSSKSRWEPEFLSKGVMTFEVNGIVQDIKENGDNEEDYIKFCIDNPFKEGNVNIIEVSVPWEGFPQLEKGEHVTLFGQIRSWWKKDIGMVTYSFQAQDIKVHKEGDNDFGQWSSEIVKEEPVRKTRRGVIPKDELFGG
mgnify:CR=1 FL=1